MKKKEEAQFLHGLLLGAIITGIVLVSVILFFLIHQADPVGEGEVQTESRLLIQPVGDIIVEQEEGQRVVLNQNEYRVVASFTQTDSGITYRELSGAQDKHYASLWSKNGQQLLYKGNESILTVTGGKKVGIKSIIDDYALLLESEDGKELIYDLKEGMVMPK